MHIFSYKLDVEILCRFSFGLYKSLDVLWRGFPSALTVWVFQHAVTLEPTSHSAAAWWHNNFSDAVLHFFPNIPVGFVFGLFAGHFSTWTVQLWRWLITALRPARSCHSFLDTIPLFLERRSCPELACTLLSVLSPLLRAVDLCLSQ